MIMAMPTDRERIQEMETIIKGDGTHPGIGYLATKHEEDLKEHDRQIEALMNFKRDLKAWIIGGFVVAQVMVQGLLWVADKIIAKL